MCIKYYNEKDIKNLTIDNIDYQITDDYNNDFLEVEFQVTNGCNYKCSYCYGQDKLSDTQFTPIEKLKFIIDQIFSISKNTYSITLLGGEITFVPELFELLQYIDSFNKNVKVVILTNGSKPIEYFEKLLTSFNMTININISIHLEYANFEHIKELIELFNKHKKYDNHIVLMPHPELKDKFKYFFDNLLELRKHLYFTFMITEIVEPPDFCNVDKRYTNEYFQLIDQCRTKWNNVIYEHSIDIKDKQYFPTTYSIINGEKIYIDFSLALRYGLKKFKGFYCCKGIDMLHIYPDGNYSGTACYIKSELHNIYDGIDLLELSKPIICPFENCGCRADDLHPKFKTYNEAEKYVNNYIKNNIYHIIKNIKNYINNIDTNNLDNNIIYNKLINNLSIIEKITLNDNINNLEININSINNNMNNLEEKINSIINLLAWWIPIKKWRDNFRDKFTRPDQTRPDQTRPDHNNSKYKKLQPMLQ